MIKPSKFGRQLGRGAGIVQLMDDLGEALAADESMLMLGGGNPGHIPEVQALFRRRMQQILAEPGEFERLIGNYDAPQGPPDFIEALSGLLRREMGWKIRPHNIAVTNGSQSASFMLFNLLAGATDEGTPRRVMLPVIPEYIGYADQGLEDGFFVSARPAIEHLDEQMFKYRVDFEHLHITDDTAAMCVSRPTNPTGNVLTDEEMHQLLTLSRQHDVPLIIDNAYGMPFPHIVFTEATPVWEEDIIMCMSLSKLGLPGVRTGIIIAHEEVVKAVSAINAIVNLTTGGFGPALALDLVRSGDIIRVSRELIEPFYRQRAARCVERLRRDLAGLDVHIHKPEGAIFLWLWLEGLPITAAELYQRLKRRGVLVLPGHHFFPGLEEDWRHRHECIRVTYSQDAADVERGLVIIAEEVRAAYAEG